MTNKSEKESKFMKEFNALPALKYFDDRESIIQRFKDLAKIIDKYLMEIEEDIKRSFQQETLDQRFHRKGTGF